MNKILTLVSTSLISILFAGTLSAQTIYCPQTYTCSVAGDINSCEATAGDTFYFNGKKEAVEHVRKGTYTFMQALTPSYNKPWENSKACTYILGEDKLIVEFTSGQNLKGILGGTSKFQDIGNMFICESKNANATDCPMGISNSEQK